jgi:hypothetical protein
MRTARYRSIFRSGQMQKKKNRFAVEVNLKKNVCRIYQIYIDRPENLIIFGHLSKNYACQDTLAFRYRDRYTTVFCHSRGWYTSPR